MECPYRPGFPVCDLIHRSNGGQEFGELKATVAALDRNVSEFRDETKERFDDLGKIMSNHGRRIATLERWRAALAGGFAVLMTLFGWAASWWPGPK